MDTLPLPLNPTSPRRRIAAPLRANPSRREWGLALTVVALWGLAIGLPAHDGASLHATGFADARSVWGIPCAVDVLSNLGFLLMGLWGWVRLAAREHARPADGGSVAYVAAGVTAAAVANSADAGRASRRAWRLCAAVFFTGLIATAAGSAYYHWQPDAGRLLVDRATMAVAFAGLMGLAATERVSARAGWMLMILTLVAAGAALVVGQVRGNLVPWGVVQFGGLVLLMGLAGLRPTQEGSATRLGLVIGVYVVAKMFEAADAPVLAWTQGLISGHSLKHLVASLAALPVLAALRQNERGISTLEDRA
jgi:hypothetical protein